MQIKSKHLCNILLNTSIPTDRKILIRLINMAALGCFHTSFECTRKILHYLSLSRVFFINFSQSSIVSPERRKSLSPPHDPRAHAFFLYQWVVTADRGRIVGAKKRISPPILGVKNRLSRKSNSKQSIQKLESFYQ